MIFDDDEADRSAVGRYPARATNRGGAQPSLFDLLITAQADIFETEELVPPDVRFDPIIHQFYPDASDQTRANLRFMLRIFAETVFDLMDGTRIEQQESIEWLNEAEAEVTFGDVCETLGYNARRMRAAFEELLPELLVCRGRLNILHSRKWTCIEVDRKKNPVIKPFIYQRKTRTRQVDQGALQGVWGGVAASGAAVDRRLENKARRAAQLSTRAHPPRDRSERLMRPNVKVFTLPKKVANTFP